MGEDTGKRAAIYARISRDKKDDGDTLDGQIELCEKLAEKYGLDVVAIYREPDGTGASEKSTAKKRVEYDRMLAAARNREFEYVLAYADDRLTRRPMELEVLIKLVEDTGLKIRTHRVENYDLSTGPGVVSARIMSAIAANEARLISERQKLTFERHAYAGKPKRQRQRAFGWEGDGVTIRESEAILIREAVEEIKAGASIASIQHKWNHAGVRTAVDPEQSKKEEKPDGQWEWSVVYRVLLGWRTAGIRTRHREPLRGADGKLVQGTWEPIISLADREQALAMLGRLSRKKLRTGSWPLAGILRCGECTKPLYGQLPSGTRSRAIYACKKGHVGISAGLLEQYLIKESVRRAYEARKHRANNPPAPKRAEDWPHFSELSETNQLIAEATAAWRDRTLPPNIAFAQITELEPKSDELQKQLDAFLAVQPAPKETPLKTVGQVLEWLMEVQGQFLRETPGKLEDWQKPGESFDPIEERPASPRSSETTEEKKERPQELPYAANLEETEELNRILRGELEMVVIRKGKAGRQSEAQFKARIDPVWRG
ncbi:recombinase family protein [Microbacterium sp. NPDC028030]|uniref:recombinase family protein n=1 Tax=Microbacterium sp. NPDC028030 TaxID=3155124 RepID=UPI0033CA5A9A